ncbi:Soluble methane monooxygenase regulatory protein B [Methylocella tundrae]|uniref:Soluble methane monooxygenase regulatory protein B n=1 Tax=Methylocella tundrae TaxID=227605 RepID=A0A8B6MAY7_METTU|nr:MmoB/DmpM family protein [Methylocella tundrae]VTZ28179.1 Soluble methane monooxygenase regulatory protein B [Methylocella tundrae]VTZ51234.1 Soluble methane monooxygenase regulatory protein B [Methylocella tundrae]
MTAKNAYNAGIMKKSGEAFAAEFFAEENQVVHESNTVVLVLMKSDEIDAIVEDIILGEETKRNPTLVVEDRGGFWWIKADGKIQIDTEKASELLGKTYSIYDFLVNVSSTIGRAYTLGNTFTITSELMGLDRKLTDV